MKRAIKGTLLNLTMKWMHEPTGTIGVRNHGCQVMLIVFKLLRSEKIQALWSSLHMKQLRVHSFGTILAIPIPV